MEKAYKLLAKQEGISNRSAKDLIDRGVVYAKGKKIILARGEISPKTVFKIRDIQKIRTIFEDDKILVIDKPAFITSEEIEKKKKLKLLHRLDKETSGVLMLSKDENFRDEVIEAFKNHEVYKEYIAWVEGVIAESIEVNEPLLTIKTKTKAYTKVSPEGKEAKTSITPISIDGKKTKIKVVIKTGRTHQIRAHLKHIGFPIIGDKMYGGKEYERMLLHASKVELLGYEFISNEPHRFKYK